MNRRSRQRMVQPWNEPERDGHAPFPVFRWQATCLPRITISLSFANSEFTFANNLRLNSGAAIYPLQHATDIPP